MSALRNRTASEDDESPPESVPEKLSEGKDESLSQGGAPGGALNANCAGYIKSPDPPMDGTVIGGGPRKSSSGLGTAPAKLETDDVESTE